MRAVRFHTQFLVTALVHFHVDFVSHRWAFSKRLLSLGNCMQTPWLLGQPGAHPGLCKGRLRGSPTRLFRKRSVVLFTVLAFKKKERKGDGRGFKIQMVEVQQLVSNWAVPWERRSLGWGRSSAAAPSVPGWGGCHGHVPSPSAGQSCSSWPRLLLGSAYTSLCTKNNLLWRASGRMSARCSRSWDPHPAPGASCGSRLWHSSSDAT